MWFLTELEILTGIPQMQLLKQCEKKGIRVGSGYCGRKYLGMIVSDEDGDKIKAEQSKEPTHD